MSNFTDVVNINTRELKPVILHNEKMRKDKIKKVVKFNKKVIRKKGKAFAYVSKEGEVVDSDESDYGDK